MAKGLAETLRATTVEAETRKREQAVTVEAEKQREARNYQRRLARQAKKFVKEVFDEEFESITHDLETAAERGDTSHKKEWRVVDAHRYTPNEEEIAKYRALSQKVAEGLAEQGLAARTLEYRGQTVDHSISIADGYSPECPPMMDAGYTLVGVQISWVEESEEA
jgi:hypothetical protein